MLEAYPFEEVETWRVIFEQNKLNQSRLAAVRARLVANGFRPLQLGDQTVQADDVWHHPDSREGEGVVHLKYPIQDSANTRRVNGAWPSFYQTKPRATSLRKWLALPQAAKPTAQNRGS